MSSPTLEAAANSKAKLWAGRILTTLVVIFTIFDGVAKLLEVPQVRAASAQLGYTDARIFWVGVIILVCTAVYLIPRTAVLGALLLTGYLGGAAASSFRAGNPAFETLFPILFGVLVWAGLYPREPRLAALIPWRTRGVGR